MRHEYLWQSSSSKSASAFESASAFASATRVRRGFSGVEGFERLALGFDGCPVGR